MASFVAKHWRLILLILGIILFIWLLYWLRTMILPFAVGVIFAYLVSPLVLWLEKKLPPRRKWPNFRRITSVILSLILVLAVVGALGYFVVETVRTASLSLLESAPYFIGQSLIEIQEWFNSVIETLPVEWQQEINAEIVNAGVTLGDNIRSALMGAVTSIPATFVTILGFLVLPFFVFYLLKDSEKLKSGFLSFFPERSIIHVRNIFAIIERVLGWYIRAQLMLGLIVGYFTFIGLYILDVPYKLALALLAGVAEMVPIVGPWISGGIAVIVTLAVVPDKAIWVAVLFVCVQLFENNLFVPKIQSAYLRIHPAVMIFLLVLGTYIAGFWGLLVIGPLTATLYEIFKYIRSYYQQPRLLEPVEPAEPG